jgi:hypothetical protein
MLELYLPRNWESRLFLFDVGECPVQASLEPSLSWDGRIRTEGNNASLFRATRPPLQFDFCCARLPRRVGWPFRG